MMFPHHTFELITRYENELRDVQLRRLAEYRPPLSPERKRRFAATRQFVGEHLVALGTRLQTVPMTLSNGNRADTSGSTP